MTVVVACYKICNVKILELKIKKNTKTLKRMGAICGLIKWDFILYL